MQLGNKIIQTRTVWKFTKFAVILFVPSLIAAAITGLRPEIAHGLWFCAFLIYSIWKATEWQSRYAAVQERNIYEEAIQMQAEFDEMKAEFAKLQASLTQKQQALSRAEQALSEKRQALSRTEQALTLATEEKEQAYHALGQAQEQANHAQEQAQKAKDHAQKQADHAQEQARRLATMEEQAQSLSRENRRLKAETNPSGELYEEYVSLRQKWAQIKGKPDHHAHHGTLARLRELNPDFSN